MRERHLLALLVMAALACANAAHAAEPQSLSFHDVVAAASTTSPAVTLAQLRLQESEARVTQSRSAFLPSVAGSASMLDHTFNLAAQGISFPKLPGFPSFGPLVGPIGMVDARVKVTQTLFDYAAWQRVKATRYGVQTARAEQSGTAEQSAQAAALAYLRAARAEAMVHAREEDLALAKELQTLAEAQLAAGTSPQIDVTRARTQVATSQGALVMARNVRDRARIDLARTLGLDPAAPIALSDTLDASLGAADVPSDEDALVRFAAEHRVELMSEAAKLARARAERAATRAERLPRIDAMADWGQSGQHWGDAIGTREYGLALSLPVFDGLKREGRESEQGSLVRESEVREKDLRDQVNADVRGALLDLASGEEQRSVAQERLKLAQSEIEQARDRFVSGVAGNIEVIDAQATLLRARDADIDARFAVASARVAIARAAGVARLLH